MREIEGGEHSILEQYLRAIAAAQRTIYIEDQGIGAPGVIDALHGALGRGVDVTYLVPGAPHPEMAAARRRPESQPFLESLDALGRHDHFDLVGIATRRPTGELQDIYVHAKIALVDDSWCTIGSTNILNRSFYGDTELNASIWHGPTVRTLRCELLREHLAHDTAALDDRSALKLYRTLARQNAVARERGQPMQGLAFSIDPATYGS